MRKGGVGSGRCETLVQLKHMKPELLEAVTALLVTRDFCGNEFDALRQWERENRSLSPEERLAVRGEVNKQWQEIREEARK